MQALLQPYRQLKRYRLFSGFTQKDIASKLGMKLSTYQAKEQGRSSFTDAEKIEIKALISYQVPDVTIDDIFFA